MLALIAEPFHERLESVISEIQKWQERPARARPKIGPSAHIQQKESLSSNASACFDKLAYLPIIDSSARKDAGV